MSPFAVIGLGAVAGGTIFLGLPFARLKNPPRTLQGFLNAIAIGILFFLLYDVLSNAIAPVNIALQHRITGTFIVDLVALIGGLTIGLLGLVAFEQRFLRRDGRDGPTGVTLGYMIATGIGMHNFAEGLAIGQAATSGVLQLAVLLIIGFGLHNMTEGFGIAAPLGGNASWRFIALAGLIGGGPTFLGTLIGVAFHAALVYILFLALAAGSIIYVLSQLLPLLRRAQAHELVMAGLIVGFTVAYGTDLVLVAAGA
ncbi:MAG: ZIP family metal transporter [Chloroflexota bacterium]|nr:ZIP family metal transporter [Chloroflexota bacterium]